MDRNEREWNGFQQKARLTGLDTIRLAQTIPLFIYKALSLNGIGVIALLAIQHYYVSNATINQMLGDITRLNMKTLAKALIQTAAFLELSGEDVVSVDDSVR